MKLDVEIRKERFTEIIDPSEELEQLETGFDFVEGPIWHPIESSLIFSDILVHGSPANMSPWNRGIFSLILNPVSNAQVRFERPEYKHHTDFTPVEPLSDDCLLTDTTPR